MPSPSPTPYSPFNDARNNPNGNSANNQQTLLKGNIQPSPAPEAVTPSPSPTPELRLLTDLERYYSSLAGQRLELIGRNESSLSQLPNLGIGASSYRLGPNDKVQIFMWGESIDLTLVQNPSFPTTFLATIGSDGTFVIPLIGRFSVQGLSLVEARELLRAELAKRYKKFDVSISIAEARQLSVWVNGMVAKPGMVSVPPGSSLLEVLSSAGGIAGNGSLRKIELWHQGSRQYVDLYPLLLGGGDDLRLVSDGDRIIVGALGNTVAVNGAVSRAGIYEFVGEPSWDELSKLAGGFSTLADTSKVKLYRSEQSGVSIQDLAGGLKAGDYIYIPSKPPVIKGRISVTGPVSFPGDVSFVQCKTLSELLTRVVPYNNVNPYYAEIKRMTSPGKPEYLSFQPGLVSQGKFDMPLAEGDEVSLFSLDVDLTKRIEKGYESVVLITGSVRYKGPVAYAPGLTIGSIVSNFSVLDSTETSAVAIQRSTPPNYAMETMTVNMDGIKNGTSLDVELKPRDKLVFLPKRLVPGINVVGMVKNPQYLEYTDQLGLLDALKGIEFLGNPFELQAVVFRTLTANDTGFVNDAGGAVIETGIKASQSTEYNSKSQALVSIQELKQNQIPDYSNVSDLTGTKYSLYDVLNSPKARLIYLMPGDTVYIQKMPASVLNKKVTVAGGVNKPGVYTITKDSRLSDLLSEAGGYIEGAYPQGLVFLRSSIQAEQAKQLDATIQTLNQKIQNDSASLLSNANADAAVIASLKAQISAQQAKVQALEDAKTQLLGRIALEIPEALEVLINDDINNIHVEENDYIFVPLKPQYVLIFGETYNQASVPYVPNKTVEYYLQNAGLTDSADKFKTYILKSNGRVLSPVSLPLIAGLFTDNLMNKIVGPGDTLVIPQKPAQESVDVLGAIKDVTTILGNLVTSTASTWALLKTMGL